MSVVARGSKHALPDYGANLRKIIQTIYKFSRAVCPCRIYAVKMRIAPHPAPLQRRCGAIVYNEHIYSLRYSHGSSRYLKPKLSLFRFMARRSSSDITVSWVAGRRLNICNPSALALSIPGIVIMRTSPAEAYIEQSRFITSYILVKCST